MTDRPNRIDRIAYVLMLFISAGTLVGWILGGIVMIRLERMTAQVEVLQARLQPVAPIDVLCEVSAQVRQVYVGIRDYWLLQHGRELGNVEPPPICLGRPTWSVPSPNSMVGKGTQR